MTEIPTEQLDTLGYSSVTDALKKLSPTRARELSEIVPLLAKAAGEHFSTVVLRRIKVDPAIGPNTLKVTYGITYWFEYCDGWKADHMPYAILYAYVDQFVDRASRHVDVPDLLNSMELLAV